jgi:hypothetical protein
MSRTRKIMLVILLVFIAMQFMRPERNSSNAVQRADMVRHFNVPANVAGILKTSCYDCHRNNTSYLWYSNIQPVGWLLAKHVNDGKEELNFNQFTTYSHRRQLGKIKSIQNSIRDGSMPLSSYTLIHPDAKFSDESKASILGRTSKTIDSLSKE